MIYIEKEGLSDDINQKIIAIRKSDTWKAIEEDNTEAIRNVFNNEFPKNEVKKVLIHEQHGLCLNRYIKKSIPFPYNGGFPS